MLKLRFQLSLEIEHEDRLIPDLIRSDSRTKSRLFIIVVKGYFYCPAGNMCLEPLFGYMLLAQI